ncbi:hypothetical protein ONS95_005348 [Cadophora gregata]|uniref:uncharacterized protein n=1 Tax=Cadophora gregata TaxID=51156 RepID=UPI0026DC136F|nr:uncharacterized protein ONS95_005348 [Cadophora gregata]KAK0103318.1 hypothetical protein ONS95_005348 [Cadophora gregata]KAK0107512.1 hypothetical protein ONS96_003320 [Cadophora gregata f. sp. sojae]
MNFDPENNEPMSETPRKRSLAQILVHYTVLSPKTTIGPYFIQCIINHYKRGQADWASTAWIQLGLWAELMMFLSMASLAEQYKLWERIKMCWRKGIEDRNQGSDLRENGGAEVFEPLFDEKTEVEMGDGKECSEAR